MVNFLELSSIYWGVGANVLLRVVKSACIPKVLDLIPNTVETRSVRSQMIRIHETL